MNEICDQTVVLSFDELRILLYSQGYRQCDGIYMPEKDFSEEEVLRAMLHMSRNDLIKEKDGDFCPRADLAEMIPVIGEPAGTMVVRSADRTQVCFCYVVPGKVVVSEKTVTREESVRLRLLTPEDFVEWKEQIENDYSEY